MNDLNRGAMCWLVRTLVSKQNLDLNPTQKGPFSRTTRRRSGLRSAMLISVWLFVVLHPLAGQEVAAHRWPVRILQRLLVPFRSDPFSQSRVSPCGLSLATCFSFTSTAPAPRSKFEFKLSAEESVHPMLELRTDYGGPLGHRW